MENVVSIVNTRTNPLEFDITIQGVDTADTIAKFVIETSGVHFVFPCRHLQGDKWACDVPPLPQIEQVSYPFHIEVVVDGYYFEPYRGTLNVTAEPLVKTSDVATSRPTVTAKVSGVEVKEDEKQTAPLEDEQLKMIARKLLDKKPRPKEVVTEKPEKSPEEIKKDQLFRQAMDDFKKPSPKKVKPVVEKTEKPKKPHKSNLPGALKKIESGDLLSEQAKKVRDIIGK